MELIPASLQEFYFTITASTGVFSGSSPLLYFFLEGGVGGWVGDYRGRGENSTAAILTMTLATI